MNLVSVSGQHPRWSDEGSRETKSHGEHEGESLHPSFCNSSFLVLSLELTFGDFFTKCLCIDSFLNSYYFTLYYFGDMSNNRKVKANPEIGFYHSTI